MKCKNCDSMEICANGLCRKCYNKAYREANKDEAKLYYEVNKDKINARSKAYHEANKDKAKEYGKAHYAANKDKAKLYYKANKDEIKAQKKLHYEVNRDPNITRFGSEEYRIKMSCSKQGIAAEDFEGFSDKGRSHLTPITRCIQLNKKFKGSEGHHIMSRVVIFMPKDIHKSISHTFKSGKNMNEINQLAINYLSQNTTPL